MGRFLAPRGPDDETLFARPGYRTVFRRLAINDAERGRQPFISADGRLVAVVNGEIYNHRDLARQYLSDVTFVSRSDCEVVVHLFRKMGTECLSKLNGIYSIAVWDEAEQALILARDRLGVKPLYYCALGEKLLFASELKALLVHPDAPVAIDWEAFRHVPNSAFPFDRPAGRAVATGLKDVAFVEPGTHVRWQDGRIGSGVRYWQPAPIVADTGRGETAEAFIDRYAELLDNSVSMQLMSDVPVGIFLSGGLDSSLLAAIAARSGAHLEAFTLVEPSITQTGDTAAAQRVARHLDMPLHMVRVDGDALRATTPFGIGLLEYYVWTMDFPLFDLEFVFKHELHRYAKSACPQMKVILLGQGADEFAGGYSALLCENWRTYAALEDRFLQRAELEQGGIPRPYQGYVSAASLDKARPPKASREAWQQLRFGDLPAYNLWHEDRMAAANGMEVRVPFLDHRLVDFLCSVPHASRESLFFDKAIERRAALRFLPKEFAERPKIPLYRSQAGADRSVSELLRAFVLEAFDGYQERYLERSDGLFDRAALLDLRDRASVPSEGEPAVRLLCRCMCIGIFDEMCRDIHQPGFEPPRLGAIASPLAATGLSESLPCELLPTSQIELRPSVRLAISCETPAALLVIQEGVLAARIGGASDLDWRGVPHEILSGSVLDLALLARTLGVDIQELTALADAFATRGWGILEHGNRALG